VAALVRHPGFALCCTTWRFTFSEKEHVRSDQNPILDNLRAVKKKDEIKRYHTKKGEHSRPLLFPGKEVFCLIQCSERLFLIW